MDIHIPIWLIWLFLIVVVITIIAIITWHFVKTYINTYYKVSTYADIPLSMKNNAIYINCINMDKYPELWEAHESDLEIYAMGMKIPSVFFRSEEVPNGYKIAYSSTLTNQQVLALMAAVKYDKFELSHDGGDTRFKVNSLSDKVAAKIASRLHEAYTTTNDRQKDELLEKIKQSAGAGALNGLKGDRIISHIDEGKSKSTSLRFQAIIPDNHEIHNHGFTPETMQYYYTYNGKLYPFEMEFVSKFENLYEWELKNLKPNTAYVGFSHSIDGGNTLFPSTSLYGVTKDENENVSDISSAELGKPPEGSKGYQIWDFARAISYMNISLIKKTCDIIVKKHHEDEFEDDFVAMTRVDEFYSKYEWVPQLEEFRKYEEKYGKYGMPLKTD